MHCSYLDDFDFGLIRLFAQSFTLFWDGVISMPTPGVTPKDAFQT